jgi:predicted MFS family arabinose efflux permease
MSEVPEETSPYAAPSVAAQQAAERSATGAPIAEGKLLAILAAIQAINILDFMMVMPLGPKLSEALHIGTSNTGYIGGSYTAAACIGGIVASKFLDKFDRRTALVFCMFGLSFGTAAGAMATNLPTLLAARILAGIFGGPATALTMAIVSDVVPAERRGRATGILMGAFAMASVLGVPTGLALAEAGTFRTPFIAVASLGILITLAARLLLPPITLHLNRPKNAAQSSGFSGLTQTSMIALTLSFVLMASTFCIFPNVATYLQYNVHYPATNIKYLYLLGGIISFVSTRVFGRLVDKVGSAPVGTLGSLCTMLVMFAGFGLATPFIPPPVLFAGMMFSVGVRNVATMTLTSKVAQPHERAFYQSVQNSVQHAAGAIGAFASSLLLSEAADKSIVGMPIVVRFSTALSLLLIPLLYIVAGRVEKNTKAAPTSAPAA